MVFQHTPLAVIDAPPLFEILPPHFAPVVVISVIVEVEMVASVAGSSFWQPIKKITINPINIWIGKTIVVLIIIRLVL